MFSKFQIGQKVVCVKTHSKGIVQAGNTYTIKGLSNNCACGPMVDVGIYSTRFEVGDIMRCATNGAPLRSDGKWWLAEQLFEPLMDNFADEVLSKAKEDGETLHQIMEQADKILTDK